ncbi:MAG: DUF2652 domain-containing protein [Candidatus Promineifilaceae bacterium]
MAKTVEGYLLIADITGYTWYLSASELEHAQDTLTELLGLLVDHTRPPLLISRLAGDAVISYALDDHFFQGQTFVEIIEDTYVAFRQAIELMVMNNTCRCNACANVSKLDLKFFLHFGRFGIQRIGDHDELVGSEVNLIHRLLKNSVTAKSGFRAYVLYTEAVIKQLDAEDLLASMTPHHESYEHLGQVKVWVQDLHPAWESRQQEMVIDIPEDEVDTEISIDIDVPPERLWDYMMQPEFRNALIGSDRMAITNRSQGRIGPGSVYQCYHGEKLVPQTIVAWQPFERIVIEQPFPMAQSNTMLGEYRLEPVEGGTRLVVRTSKPWGPVSGRLLYKLMRPIISRMAMRLLVAFKERVEDDYRQWPEVIGSEAEIDKSSIRAAAAAGLQVSTDPAEG